MRYENERVPHYVKHNDQTRQPRRHIFLHSVAKDRAVKGGNVKTWHAACATFRVAEKGRRVSERTTVFTEPRELWEAVVGHTKKGARTVLWAHNLGYDVRLSDALHWLPRMGWQLTAHNLAPKGTWLVWERDGITLSMVDSAAVFPKLLHQVGALFGLNILQKTLTNESSTLMMARARAGELIVRTAITEYLAWLDRDDMGNWQMTGAGQSYAVFRHKFLTHKMLVHDDMNAIAMERRAMWTGRCEAYWHGTLTRQVVDEWDFTSAYATVCAENEMPVKLLGPVPEHWTLDRVLASKHVAVLAHVTVTTTEPVVPTLNDGRILWPVGRFETTLWDVEIREAQAHGAIVEFDSGYMYKTAPALKAWAEWILAALATTDESVPAWQKVVMKHWSTACPGRFAMAFPVWEEFAGSPRIGVDRRICLDADTGESYEIMQVGKNIFKQGALQEWSQSQPAITGYVMACARVKLWRVIKALPKEATLYVDTDSILVTDNWRSTMLALAQSPSGRGLRLKRSWDGFAIYGPRQLITGKLVRVAGVPTTARRIDKHVFAGQVWESLPVSMGNHRADRVVLRDRVWHAKCVDRRRKGSSLGWTKPLTIGVTE